MVKPVNTLDSFRALHDESVVVPNKIRAALATVMKESAEGWRYEGDLLKLAGISTTQLAGYREEFKNHIVEIGGRNAKRVWFADPKVATKATRK